jgi:hypothetical protein
MYGVIMAELRTKEGGSASANPPKRYENQQYDSQYDCSGNRLSVHRFQLGSAAAVSSSQFAGSN